MNSITLFFVLSILLGGCGFKSKEVDLIVHNAKIYSVDENFSIHQAIAISGDSIVALGPEREILNEYKGKKHIDAQGAVVYPGFIDAHSHLMGYSVGLLNLDLRDAKSFEEVLEQLENKKSSSSQSIMGRGWDESNWPNKELPSRSKIDELFPETPVILYRVDGHSALVNGAMFKLAGIDENSSIDGGIIDYKSGIIKENAIDFVVNLLPPPDQSTIEGAMEKGAKNCHAVGLTTVCDAGLTPEQISSYLALVQDKKLAIRTYAMADPSPENFDFFNSNGAVSDPFFRLKSVKAYADGSLGSRSAALLEPYHDDPHNHGILTTSPDSIAVLAAKCKNLNLQLNTHCIGDRALKRTLEVYANALEPANDRRWRIEHFQVYDSSDLEKVRVYGIIPSIQPTHATSDAKWAQDRLGEERLPFAYAYQTLKNQLGWVALGTDFPVEDISPLATFHDAVFRKKIDSEAAPFQPNEALTREEALRGITQWAALSMHMEELIGTLEPGKKADLVLLNTDLMKCAPESFKDIEVLKTILGGKVVYEKL